MNQHYVPRSYLKNFALKKGKEYFVDVFDKTENRYFNTNIKNVCSEIDLYTLTEDNSLGLDKLFIEKVYANGVEPMFLKTCEILTNNRIFRISENERMEMLISIFQLYARNPIILYRSINHHKKEILRLCNLSRNNGIKGVTYLGEDFSFSEWHEEQIIDFFKNKVTQEFKEKHLNGIGELGEFHQHAKIVITIARGESQFITGDNPLVTQDYMNSDEHPLLRSKEFILNLNKKYSVKLYHDNTKMLNTIYRCEVPNGSVALINSLIYEQSSRFIIGERKAFNDFFELKKFFDNTSLQLKIQGMRETVNKIPTTDDNKEIHELMQAALDKYDKEGTLTDKYMHELHIKFKEIGFAYKRKNNNLSAFNCK